MSQCKRLRDLIDVSQEDVEKALAEHAREGAGGGGLVGFAASVGADELNKALDQDIGEVLAGAWGKVKDVHDAAKRSREHPGDSSVVTLGEHEMTSIHHPVLKAMVDDVPVMTLEFTLELIAKFKSVKLSISNGRIRKLGPGEASAVARLKYRKLKLTEKSTPALNLPGEIPLGDGVPVP